MNPVELYDVVSTIVNHLTLEIRLRRVLKYFSLGVLVSRSCLLDDVAQALTPLGTKDSQYRRLQRFLANPRVTVANLQREWASIVVQAMQPTSLTLLVDETALSKHLKIMVVGIWTPGGCVPVAWRCYHPDQYPACGQVNLIVDLLDRIRPVLPFPLPIQLLADRGIGTSPDLIRKVEDRSIQVLFRVQGSTRFRYPDGRIVALRDLGMKGYVWQAPGDVFKKAKWLSLYATVACDKDYEHPWCLVSSDPIEAQTYGLRFDQEGCFRDFKSDGFQWHRSHIWLPDHTDRLLLVVSISYWVVMAVGQSQPPVTKGRAARWSDFRRGLEVFKSLFHPTIVSILPTTVLTRSSRPPPRITYVVQ